MVCACNKAAKILTGLGVCFIIGAVIVLIAAQVGVQASFDVETQGGSRSFTYTIDNEATWGFTLYIPESAECQDHTASGLQPTVDIVHTASGLAADFNMQCTHTAGWAAQHEPPLQRIGTFNPIEDPSQPRDEYGQCTNTDHCTAQNQNYCSPTCDVLTGSYSITCSVDCWVVDDGEEVTEAVGGILGYLYLLLLMIALAILGSILFCIAGCCCCQGPDKVPGQQQVQGQVIGQPVFAQ